MPVNRPPRVSILLASHRSPWLRQAVQSVLDQTYEDFELLLLDDADEQRARELAAAVGDSRLRYLPSPEPLGPAANHDRGLTAARGSLIAIINHDDVWRPHLLARLVAALDAAPAAVVAFADHGSIDEDGVQQPHLAEQVRRRYGRASLAAGLHRPFRQLAAVDRAVPVAQAAVWRRDAVRRIPTWVHGGYDGYIAYQLCRGGAGAVYVAEELADWRQHTGSLIRAVSLPNAFGVLRLTSTIALDPQMASVRRQMLPSVLAAARGLLGTARHAAVAHLRRPTSSIRA